MYIESVPNRKSPPAILLREGKRVGNKVVKRTLANLTRWPKPVIEGLRTLLKGGVALGKDDACLSITRSLLHGHVAAVLGAIRNIGLDKMMAYAQGCWGILLFKREAGTRRNRKERMS